MWILRLPEVCSSCQHEPFGMASTNSPCSMSVRNFERVFTREVGTTPSQYVLQMRVEAARRQLERTDTGLKHVASAAGFGSVDVMRRAFVRLLGITPRRYREFAEHSICD